jgi:hypothetical protein
MTLDPIVSFSVAVAEAPGSYAFFLGSGVSRDAGVPTGGQVFWRAVGELYRLEKKTEETPDQEALAEWLKETERDGLNYSGLLELIAPDQATRRDYLAKHFEGREPGPTHERLAQLVEQGYIRVFITTNFDRLLENALKARGIEPVVISSAAELRSAPRREHAPCYVLKPHGDYLQETIRNTPGELEKLEPGITKELREIFERFGIVVLGYSGSDEAIAATLRSRRSRYGLYWVARSKLGEGAEKIVEVTGGRVIKRDGAAEFLADLQRRLEVFKSHPSGHTPVEVHDEVLALIRSGDNVGLAEVMRRERREFSDGLSEIIASHRQLRPSEEGNLLSAHDQILPLLERRLASLLPVIAYAPEAFEQEVRSLTDFLENQPLRMATPLGLSSLTGRPGGWDTLVEPSRSWRKHGFLLAACSRPGTRTDGKRKTFLWSRPGGRASETTSVNTSWRNSVRATGWCPAGSTWSGRCGNARSSKKDGLSSCEARKALGQRSLTLTS